MAQHGGEQYGRQTDEYGNPIQHPGGMAHDQYGTTGGAHGMTHGGAATGMHGTEQYGTTGATGMHGGGMGTGMAAGGGQGQHRRSGSSSSSSSEDDGQGGRRKKEKGLKDKIMEKLPGGGHKDEQTQATGMPGGYEHQAGGEHEKKGMMDKIKEKLPGSGH